MSTTALVTGPTGKAGRRLIPLLTRRGVTVRSASRSPLQERPASSRSASTVPTTGALGVLNDDVLDVPVGRR